MSLLQQLLIVVILICCSLINLILRIQQIGKRKYCPPIKNGLLKKSGSELAQLIRTRKFSSEEVVRAFIQRAKEVNPVVNAIVQDRYNIAIKEAQEVDELIKSNVKSKQQLEADTPLLGVPITIKESIAVKGMSNEAGRVKSVLQPATEDASVVEMIKKAGAVIILVSNTPEFSLGFETTNYVTGTTRNPYDTRRSTAGSSGGEAALISSGASVIGLGTDVAGSLRAPAMYTGIFSHKPTSGITNIDGILPKCYDSRLPLYCSIGPLTRYAKDLPLVMSSILKPEAKAKLKIHEPVQISDLQFYYIEEEMKNPFMQKDVKKAIYKFIEYLSENHGVQTKQVAINNIRNSFITSLFTLLSLNELHLPFYNKETGKFHYWEELFRFITCKAKTTPSLMAYGAVKKISTILHQSTTRAIKKNDKLKTELEELLGPNGVLIHPTFPQAAGFHNEMNFFKVIFMRYLIIFNTTGLPATHCPAGLNSKGLPIGFQIITSQYNDKVNFAIAREVEKAFGGWIPPPESATNSLQNNNVH